MNKEIFFLTTPIYYVNDVPHIGHAYTTIAADVLNRWKRLHGEKTFFLTGTDEHGMKIIQSAKEHGVRPEEYCDKISAEFKSAWADLGIEYDFFIRTTSPLHQQAVGVFMGELWKQGKIYRGRYQGLYCIQCERFYSEEELIDGRCPDHGIRPVQHSEENYFFRLSEYRNKLLEILENPEHPQHLLVYPESRRREIVGKLRKGLNDLSISREHLSWGIPLPFDQNQTTYVWVDALLNYLSAIGYGKDSERFSQIWPADWQLMAKDILWFHAVIWPALLLAVGLPLPRRLFAHGFFTVEREKMSKTRGNVIAPAKLIAKFGKEATRYLLLTAFPLGSDGDISLDCLEGRYNAMLANNLGNFVSRTLTMVKRFNAGKIPHLAPEGGRLLVEFQGIIPNIVEKMDNLDYSGAWGKLEEAINVANRYIEEVAPWNLVKTEPARVEAFLADLLMFSRLLAVLYYPVFPEIAQRLNKVLAPSDEDFFALARQVIDRRQMPVLPSGKPIEILPALFPRL